MLFKPCLINVEAWLTAELEHASSLIDPKEATVLVIALGIWEAIRTAECRDTTGQSHYVTAMTGAIFALLSTVLDSFHNLVVVW